MTEGGSTKNCAFDHSCLNLCLRVTLRVLSHFDPYFVKSSKSALCPLLCSTADSSLNLPFIVSRHVEAGLIPGHSEAQLEAIEVLEQTAQRLSLHMVLKVGDIQFVADSE